MQSQSKSSLQNEIVFPAVGLNAMERVASAIADAAIPGQIIRLNGDLGAGKTTLTQLIAKAFGVAETVASPTFTLQKMYPLQKPRRGIETLLHYDLYRIKDWEEVMDLELFDLSERAVTIVEWAERFDRWSPDTAEIRLEYIAENTRAVTLRNLPISLTDNIP